VELLVALDQATLHAVELVPPRARFVLGLTTESELLVLRLEDQLLLARSRFGLDAAGFGLRGLDRLRCPQGPSHESEYGAAGEGHEDHRQNDRCLHRLFLPS